MNGNPHYDPDGAYRTDSMEARAIAESILALAYEQHTANLIAMHTGGPTDLTGWPQEIVDSWLRIGAEIETRLGLNGDTK